MKILALIPARGGSRRIPGKNLRALGGKPLIAWSIDAVRGMPAICDVLVSTDDAAIAEAARDAGAHVPWARPTELATDTATSVDVALHALERHEEANGHVDGLLLLQPTSPFRRRASIERALDLFAGCPSRPVVSFSPALSHPMWCFRSSGDGVLPFIEGNGVHLRSQDLEPAWVVNGAIYLVSPQFLRSEHSFFGESVNPLFMKDVDEGHDIDTELDWETAVSILHRSQVVMVNETRDKECK